ncbi:ABC transporter substrate-binding protein [Lederbergia ruris]|uniref:ABC transporter substrate-binding protein n=1 Tax=Lederbergia ruris TaxID=217495 RepID=UPI0039A12CCC
MKSRFGMFFVFSLLLVSLVLSGCSSKDSSGNGTEDKRTTVKLWHPLTNEGLTAINAVIEAFEKNHPEIKIDATYVANQGEGQNEKLLAAIAGGNPPDVAYFDRFEIGSWANQGSLEELTEMAEKEGVTKDKFYPFAWDEANYDDKLYGLPITTDARLVYFNIDQFKEVGLDPNDPPKTIAELEEAAEKLTIKKGNKFERVGFIPWYAQGWLYTWGWSFGGDFYDEETKKVTANDPKVVEALQWEVDFAKKYNVEDIAGFTDSQGSAAMDPFITGQISMKVSNPGDVLNIKKYKPDLNFDVFPIPTPSGQDHTTWSGGWSAVMPKGAKNKEAGFEFMKFFASEEGQKIFSELSGAFATIDSVNEEIGYKDDPIFGKFIEMLPVAHHRPVIKEGSLYWNELSDAVEKATRGKGTPQELLDEVTEKVNKELDS